MKLVFCTHNAHKLKEAGSILGRQFVYLTLDDIAFHQDIPEPYDTLHENAQTKAMTVFMFCGRPCFAEDTGLFVPALNDEPGVKSARYAGEHGDSLANMDKLLKNLSNRYDRQAFFRTVICYVDIHGIHYFEGRCDGRITEIRSGDSGFGYDPIFIPDGSEQTFATMTLEQKNIYSHRRKAFEAFAAFLAEKNNDES